MFTEYHRLFRVIPSQDFLMTFASNRSHMKKSDGSWIKSPPGYEPISTPQSVHNLVYIPQFQLNPTNGTTCLSRTMISQK